VGMAGVPPAIVPMKRAATGNQKDRETVVTVGYMPTAMPTASAISAYSVSGQFHDN